MNDQDKIKEIEKKITMVGIYDAPGAIMIGLALHAKFAANGKPLLEILNNPDVVNTFFVVGSLIMAWGGYSLFTLSREKSKLLNAKNV